MDRLRRLVLVSAGCFAVFMCGVGLLWIWAPTEIARCDDDFRPAEEFVSTLGPGELGWREAPEVSVVEGAYFECEWISLRPADGDTGARWLSFRRTAAGAADDSDALQAWRDNNEFTGVDPMTRGRRFIFADDCLMLAGQHDGIEDPVTVDGLRALFQKYRVAVSCPPS